MEESLKIFQYAGFIWKLMGEMGEMGSVYEQYYTGERVHICAYLITESARERALNELSIFV